MTDFALEIDVTLLELRELAEAMMVDACTVREADGEPTTDQSTGDVSVPPGDVVYSGPCRVQITSSAPEQADAGETRYQLLNVVVSVPIDATRYEQGYLVTIDASRHDPALVGERYRVEAVVSKSHATARRLICEEGVS